MDWRLLKSPALAVVAAVYGFLWAMAGLAGPIFGAPLAFLLLLSLSRYGYELLRDTARRRNRETVPDVESLQPFGDYRAVLHALLFALLVILAATARLLPLAHFEDGAVLIGAAGLALAYPASAAWLALTTDLAGALNPLNVVRLVRALGRRYALLVGVCAGLLLAARLPSAVPGLPGFLAAPLDDMLSVWAVLAIFVLTGSELRAHRHLFVIPGEREPPEERAQRERYREWGAVLDRAYGSLRSGLRQQGYKTIRELVEREHGSLHVQQWVFERMLEWEDKRDALGFASHLVDSLLAQGEYYDALEIVTRCRRFYAAFELSAASAEALAAFARSIGRAGSADELAASAAAVRAGADPGPPA
jgi:hypothetical protein